MQTLLNQLTNPVPEFQDGGVIKYSAPTSVMLRAARELKTLLNVTETNAVLISQLQNSRNELLATLERLNNEIKTLRDTISKPDNIGESVLSEGPEDADSTGI